MSPLTTLRGFVAAIAVWLVFMAATYITIRLAPASVRHWEATHGIHCDEAGCRRISDGQWTR